MPRILYVTFSGLLSHLGHSQVVRYLERLAERGVDYTVLSLERRADLDDTDRLAEFERRLAERGIEWERELYSEGGAVSDVAGNLMRALGSALDVARGGDIDLMHARSHLGGGIAHLVERTTGTPYLFDIRGYWIDERLEADRWFTNSLALAAGRFVERRLYERARGIVALTETSAKDVRNGRLCRFDGDTPVEVIPTCADYDEFADGGDAQEIPEELEAVAESDDLVIGYVGSVKPAYRVEESLRLFEKLRRRRDDVHLLCATGQIDRMSRLIARHSIPVEDVTVTSVPHEQMSGVLQLIDWGFLLVEKNYTRRAMMPTKLAELFAAGVRPIHHGCNDDVQRWVERAGSGISLGDLTEPELERAATRIANSSAQPELLDRAREITREHFGLEAGVQGYEQMYERILSGDDARPWHRRRDKPAAK